MQYAMGKLSGTVLFALAAAASVLFPVDTTLPFFTAAQEQDIAVAAGRRVRGQLFKKFTGMDVDDIE